MSSPEKSLSLIKKAYIATVKSLISNPSLFAPFLIFALVELAVLIVLSLAPRTPLNLIFAPPIRTFWGEQFLHYPANFLLLPKLASLSRMVLTILLGSLLSGMAVAIVSDLYNKRQIKLGTSFKEALKKYISLFIVVLLLIAIYHFAIKIITVGLVKYFTAGHSRLLFLKPQIWLGQILTVINFVLLIVIQSAFIYAIPVLIIEKAGLIKAIIRAFALFTKLFIPTIILVGLPMFIYIPILVLHYNAAFLISKVFPESILFVGFLSIIISSLVIDVLVTVSTTYLYLMKRE